jgi:hypothetical protein
MKVSYENFGCLRLEAEDGRDNAWLQEMAKNLFGSMSKLIDHIIVFEDEKGEEITAKEAMEQPVLKAMDLNAFGHLASPYEFRDRHEVYWEEKKGMKRWIKMHAEKLKKGEHGREDAVKWWNETFPKEQIK